MWVVIVNNFTGGTSSFVDCLNAGIGGVAVTWAQFLAVLTSCS